MSFVRSGTRRVLEHLVLLALLLALALGRLGADLLVVLLEGRKVLAGLPCRATHRVTVRAAPGIEAAAGAVPGIEAAAGAAQGIEAAVGAAGRTSENSPSSMPSPTYQWTKARLAYMRSNLWSSRAHASAMAVVFESMQTAR